METAGQNTASSAQPNGSITSTESVQRPAPRFNPRELYKLSENENIAQQKFGSPGADWISVFEHACGFKRKEFLEALNFLVRNPNVTSTVLFRADILYDSDGVENVDVTYGSEEHEKERPGFLARGLSVPGFDLKRTVVRKFIPRNDSLDRSINQSVLYYEGSSGSQSVTGLMLMFPHVSSPDRMPFYHPAVKGIAYFYHQERDSSNKTISVHYQLFPDQALKFTDRQIRIARNLLHTLYKHGQGNREGYQKRVHHDQIIEQKRVQDTFAELKKKYAHRLMQNWVEVTDPKKQVFEQIGIAAFLIELWRDMYAPPDAFEKESKKPPFPGFVDVGCGNGVLVEILLLSGHNGWGIEGHKRKTWATLSPKTQKALVHGIVVPAPLDFLSNPDIKVESVLGDAWESIPGVARSASNDMSHHPSTNLKPARVSPFKTLKSWLSSKPSSSDSSSPALLPTGPPTQNGIFLPFPSYTPSQTTTQEFEGPFLVSNHADELTAWTPLLASLTNSAFFILPCCSRNLSGERFRAPSYANGFSADGLAPEYFATQKEKGKGRKYVAIPVQMGEEREEEKEEESVDGEAEGEGGLENEALPCDRGMRYRFVNIPCASRLQATSPSPPSAPRNSLSNPQAVETGDLKALSPRARSKQPSAYQSLCSWVVHLADKAGYLVEREYLRIPSTRNYGIVGRFVKSPSNNDDGKNINGDTARAEKEAETSKEGQNFQDFRRAGEVSGEAFEGKMRKVLDVVRAEGGASREKWVGVCEREVVTGKDLDHI